MMATKSRKIDNPLLQSTLRKSTGPSQKKTTAKDVKQKLAVVKREIGKPKYFMSPDEEKASVFEIITDLEKQLEASFSIKDAQEKEIAKLQKSVQTAEEKAATLDAKLKELKSVLVSQEELNSELEFLENERLEVTERIRLLEDESNLKDQERDALNDQIEGLNKDIEARDTRIEQIELELNSTNATIQNFQNQIYMLEEEKDILSDKLEGTADELNETVGERDNLKIELQKAKESLDEIRLMLADTRAKARGHYYKKRLKQSS